MPKQHNSFWQFVCRHRFISSAAGYVVIMAVFAMMLLGNGFFSNVTGAFAASCSSGDKTYVVQWGDTLSSIAQSNKTTLQNLASYNKLSNPDSIFFHQDICIPTKNATQPASSTDVNTVTSAVVVPAAMTVPGIRGTGNYFPYGQCTWWANQRYFQMTGVYVPWTTNSNATQWDSRARDFRWHISSEPTVGSIMRLSSWVQGAGGYGHVGIVEKVLGNGHFQVSQMNWSDIPGVFSYGNFHTGAGVSFITYR